MPGDTPSPPSGPIGAHWDFVRSGDGAVPIDAVRSDLGWVAVGTTCADASCAEHVAGAWASPDGLAWTAGAVTDRDGATLGDVAWNGEAFFALGNRVITGSDGTLHSSAIVWRSTDGTTWTPMSTIELGPRRGDGPWAHGLAVSQAGVLVVAGIDDPNTGLGGVFAGHDGTTTWTHVGRSPVGLGASRLETVDAIAAEPGIVLASACTDCPVSAWESPDGVAWAKVGMTAGAPQAFSIVTDGIRIVVAQTECHLEACSTSIWTAPQGGPFTQSGPNLDLTDAYLAFTGTTGFVLVGRAPVGARVLTSADGLAWVAQRTDLRLDDCAVNGLASGPAEVLLLGCGGVFVSRGV